MGAWPLLTTDDLDLTLNSWDLTQTLSDTLGDLGTPADGFDSYLSETITLLSGLENLGGSLLDDLNLAAGIAGSIDRTSLDSDAASLPASLAAGDAIVADANALLGSVGPPQPPDGGSGGGGAASCGVLDFGSFAVIGPIGSNTAKQTLYLQNNTANPLTVKSTTWSPDLGFTYQINPAIVGAVIGPGAQLAVTILFTPGSIGQYNSTLTIATDGPDPQPCLSVSGTGTPGTPPTPPNPRCPTGNLVSTGHITIKPLCA